MTPSREISRLIEIMAALRTPGAGCPWDLQQDFKSIVPYTIEEAYEVADAIERGDMDDLRRELGDLLLQPVYHARMAEEAGHFDFGDVVETITRKMIGRHPHVFGDADNTVAEYSADGMAKETWEKMKAAEKAAEKRAKGAGGKTDASLLEEVPRALPGLTQAVKLQKKASSVGFDWNDPNAVMVKIREELDETEAELSGNPENLKSEIGDILFAVANLARHLDIDPESALRAANAKFRRRFAYIEKTIAKTGHTMNTAGLETMESLWQESKSEV